VCKTGLNNTRACIRQPWHDIHAKVEGPVAMDICLNFLERWAKQAGKAHLKDMTHLDDHNDIHLPEGFEAFAVRAGGYFVPIPCIMHAALPHMLLLFVMWVYCRLRLHAPQYSGHVQGVVVHAL